ncbi:centrosomal protein of 83 kDa [Eurytemora carolleeae]|uniref:centrosomal protein of 83 kDa n=1 Tax=Eurytemora carolleeae TaxID=1294199 RepID=UPI000C762B76|nr:centrosomal protein of 83 kDa [Eurytemora carolleeae]|eukprot:XP_023334218.1 centrosomal protein of 83 kDa-like [Eurytemora affinis]
MYSGVGLQDQSGGLPDSDILLPGRLGEVELSGVLNLLEKDQELQDLLCDVQERAENHRENYSKLKLEHSKLIHQVKVLESELGSVQEENIELRDQIRVVSEKAAQETTELRTQIILFKEQGPSGVGIKTAWTERIKEEVETSWRERWKSVTEDLENQESRINELIQENSHLKHSYQVGLAEVDSSMKELVFSLETKLASLEKEKKQLIRVPLKLEEEKEELEKRIHDLNKQNRTMLGSIEHLESELQKSISQLSLNESAALKSEGVLKSKLVKLQSEKDSLEGQLRSSTDEVERKERRIEQLEQLSADLRSKMEAAHRAADQIKQSSHLQLSEMEMETAKQLASVRREKENANKEKVELEFKYTELKSRYDDIHREHKVELTGLEQGYISSRREMGHTEQEYQVRLGELTAKLQSLEFTMKQLENENTHLKREKEDFLLNIEDDMQRLSRENAALRKGNLHFKMDVENILKDREEIIETAEKRENELNTVIKKFEKQNREILNQIEGKEKNLSEKIAKYKKLIHKLRNKLKLATAEKEESTLRKECMRGYVSPEKYHQVKSELKEIKQKQKQFSNLIQNLQDVETQKREGEMEIENLNASLDSLDQLRIQSLQFNQYIEFQLIK